MRKKIIFVPHWMQTVLSRNGLKLDACIDPKALRKYFSANDLGCFIALQRCEKELGICYDDDYGAYNTLSAIDSHTPDMRICVTAPGQYTTKHDHVVMNMEENQIFYNPLCDEDRIFFNSLYDLASSGAFNEELKMRLFSQNDAIDQTFDAPFEVHDVDEHNAFVVINPNYFIPDATGELDRGLVKSFITAILKLFYVYEPYHVVANTELFNRYLVVLSGQTPE